MLSTAPETISAATLSVHQQRKLWTVEECKQMMAAGINLERYELVDGDLIEKGSKGDVHCYVVAALARVFFAIFGVNRVLEQNPIRIPDQANSPEPDITIMNRDLSRTILTPEEIVLLVEVSDSTLRDDLGRKAILYAKAGIVEYWVLNIEARSVIVHRGPDAKFGTYNQVTTYRDTEAVSPAAAPHAQIVLNDIL
jgi:Uma2 family endonuclease